MPPISPTRFGGRRATSGPPTPYTRPMISDPSATREPGATSAPPTGHQLHLVRHGEVHNPDHLVYAALPGFTLSPAGIRQAEAAAAHLADRPVVLVVSSPLERAVETATHIADRHGVPVVQDENLTEWGYSTGWAGRRWEDLPEQFPGELEAYLADPSDLGFGTETLDTMTARMETAVSGYWRRRHPPGDLVIVSHQDPVEALRRRLTGRTWDRFHEAKPSHASVVSLAPGDGRWHELQVWEPPNPDDQPSGPVP